jgi:hypothetical protein
LLERDDSNHHPAPSFCLSMISAQTLRVCREGKPVSTFPDHALGAAMAPAVVMPAPAIPAVMMPAAAPVSPMPMPVPMSAPDLDQRIVRHRHGRNAEPCGRRCGERQHPHNERVADQQNPFHDFLFLQCAGASATPPISVLSSSMADINGKKRQWFRQEAVSPWDENPLWWLFESA